MVQFEQLKLVCIAGYCLHFSFKLTSLLWSCDSIFEITKKIKILKIMRWLFMDLNFELEKMYKQHTWGL